VGSRVRNRAALTPILTVEKLVPGGAGFCRLPDGRPAFVDGALPGDRVRVLTQRDKKSFVEATSFELVEAGAERVTPPCPVAEDCGGCALMALPYPVQLREKAAMVAEALARTGGVRLAAPPDVVHAGAPLAYRLRVRFHLDERGNAGFFARRSQLLVEPPSCAVLAPELARVFAALRALPVGQKRTLGAHFSSVDLRAVPEDGGVELELVPRNDKVPSDAAMEGLVAALGEHARVGSGAQRRSGLRRYPLPGGGFLRVPSGGFTQVNWDVNARLIAQVVEGAVGRRVRTFLDLYAGVGNFTVPLALAGLTGTAVELEHQATAALREALREQGLSGVQVVEGDVGTVLAKRGQATGADLAVLDPPRAGAKSALAPLMKLAPRVIAYVACDPVTLARDLRVLLAAGFALESVTCFDMFPQTQHVETLAWLVRG
jgi:23S rRNA (uracil1939-C5)-methyltransferase